MRNTHKKVFFFLTVLLVGNGCISDIRYPQLWLDSSVENCETRGLSSVGVKAYDLLELNLEGVHTVYLPVGYSGYASDYKTTVMRSDSDEQKMTILIEKNCYSHQFGSVRPTLPDIHTSTRCYYNRQDDTLKIMVCGESNHSHFYTPSRMQVRLPTNIEVVYDSKLGLTSSGMNPIGFLVNEVPDPAVWQPCLEKPTRLRSLAEQEK